MKIYTKKGDQGTTCLVSGEPIEKGHIRLESYGTLDELNSLLGLCRSLLTPEVQASVDSILFEIQNDLFNIGSQLANINEKIRHRLPNIDESDIKKLEDKIDELTEGVEPLKKFILPGGTPLSSYFHLARTVCRRAERVIIRLKNENDGPLDPLCIQYVNRLSDLLFIMARFSNAATKTPDVVWDKNL